MNAQVTSSRRHRRLTALAVAAAVTLAASTASADAVTDWNDHAVKATKGFNGTTGAGVALGSNPATRIEAIAARAVFDAVNAVDHFSPRGYHYNASHTGSAPAAAAQAAHDVLLSLLPNPAADAAADARWTQVRLWLDTALADTLAGLGVAAGDGGIAAGQAAAAAAVAARALDNSGPATTYGAALVPTSNPGIGLWRQSNAAGAVNPATGAPTGFDAAGVIQGRPGADLNWRDVTPFSLTPRQKAALVADVPLPPAIGGYEYAREVDFLRRLGQDTSVVRSADQTAQALYYKQDAEVFVYEAARLASAARGLSLDHNAKLFALLANAVVDARIAAWGSKYEQKFWRPITVLNADASGAVTNGYAAWRPLAATPSHPSNTSGHSADRRRGLRGAARGVRRLRPPRRRRRHADHAAVADRHQQRHRRRDVAPGHHLQPGAARERRQPPLPRRSLGLRQPAGTAARAGGRGHHHPRLVGFRRRPACASRARTRPTTTSPARWRRGPTCTACSSDASSNIAADGRATTTAGRHGLAAPARERGCVASGRVCRSGRGCRRR